MWKMEQALNKEVLEQMRKEYFIYKQNIPGTIMDQSYHQIMKSPIDITLIGSAPFE